MGHSRRRILLVGVLLLVLLLLVTWWSPGTDVAPESPPPDVAAGGDSEPDTLVLTGGGGLDEEFDGVPLDKVVTLDRNPLPPRVGIGPLMGEGRAKRRVWLTGELTGSDGKPLPGVVIRLVPELMARVVTRKHLRSGEMRRMLEIVAGRMQTVVHRAGRIMIEGTAVGKTDAHGRFEIPAPPATGNYRVTFHPAGKKQKSEILLRTGRYRFAPGDEGSLGVLRRPAGGTLSGVVVDTAGQAVGGTTVSYWPDAWGQTMEDLLPPGSAPVEGLTHRARKISSSPMGIGAVDADEEGRFTIRDVVPGTHTLQARVPGVRACVSHGGVRVNEGEAVAGLRIVVDRAQPPLIAGRVLDDDTGKPIQAQMRLQWESRSSSFCFCRPDGSFIAAALPPGDYWVHARKDGYVARSFGPYTLAAGQRLTGLELRLSPKDE